MNDGIKQESVQFLMSPEGMTESLIFNAGVALKKIFDELISSGRNPRSVALLVDTDDLSGTVNYGVGATAVAAMPAREDMHSLDQSESMLVKGMLTVARLKAANGLKVRLKLSSDDPEVQGTLDKLYAMLVEDHYKVN